MSDDPDGTTYEYAIEVPGQGWLLIATPFVYSLVAEPVIISDRLDEAQEDLRKAQNFYSRIGAAVVGDELRLVVRSVTVVRSGWDQVSL